jgi:hypothetical protein
VEVVGLADMVVYETAKRHGLLLGEFPANLPRTLVSHSLPRRIERLLNATPANATVEKSGLTPLTEGLLLLSINHLRTYALTYLPARSRLQDGFLEDIDDLQDSKNQLTREDRLKVIDRMWRSWSTVLGWNTITSESRRISQV